MSREATAYCSTVRGGGGPIAMRGPLFALVGRGAGAACRARHTRTAEALRC
jgi:hypothetical protein